MYALYLNVTAILFALVSALCWGLSAKIKFQFGFDVDKELNAAMTKAAKLNAWAATFAALATISQASAMFLDAYTKVRTTECKTLKAAMSFPSNSREDSLIQLSKFTSGTANDLGSVQYCECDRHISICVKQYGRNYLD